MPLPAKYNTPDDFMAACRDYIGQCKANGDIPSIPGACIAMGFKTRQSFYDQADRDKEGSTGWAECLEYCRLAIQDGLMNDRSTMAMFLLKAKWGYKEYQHIELSGKVDSQSTVITGELPPEQAANLYEQLLKE